MKAVVMCGGAGSRLRPLTENMPKPMVRLLNKHVIDIIINRLIDSGIDEIYLSLGYMAADIIEFCERSAYKANIHYCEEEKPLGTAGGVKNCIKSTNDDLIILSGDNVFDFKLDKIMEYHRSVCADVTVVGVEVDDPREYGCIIKDEDGTIKYFTEKPTWEQAQSRLVNTGIYFIRGEILSLIPENSFYDFSENLFPLLFSQNRKFMCYHSDGFWGDIGEFEAYRNVTQEILSGHINSFPYAGTFYSEDGTAPGGGAVIAPCIIGNNVTIKENSTVGPFCVIGEGTRIADGCVIEKSIIGFDCEISANSDVHSTITSDCVKISENTVTEENTVIGFGCNVGRFSRILSGCKIWPGKRINPESVIGRDMYYETPGYVELDIFGLSGKLNSQITATDAAKIGQSIASLKTVKRVGVGCDAKKCSAVFKDACAVGVQTCGVICYDFDEIFKSQAYFYSSYCSLDAFIYVSTTDDIINFSFFGKNGLPFSSSQARTINNNYRFSSFSYAAPGGFIEKYNMGLLSTVYKSALQKILKDGKCDFSVKCECENHYLKTLFEDVLQKSGCKIKNSGLQFLINESGTDMYFVEKEKFYSASRILSLLCELEFSEGHDVIISEDAPSVIEEKAKQYGRKALRVYECSTESKDNLNISNHIWAFDAVFLAARLLALMSQANMSAAQLMDTQTDFALRKNIYEFNCEPRFIREKIKNSGGERAQGDIYFVVKNRKGCARIRQLGNGNRIRVLVEAADMEAAKELSADITGKINSCDIDKNN